MPLFAEATRTWLKHERWHKLPECDYIVVDLESHGLAAAFDPSVEVYFACTLTVQCSGKPRLKTWYNMTDLCDYLNVVCAWGTTLVYHNAKFDHSVLTLRGLSVPWQQIIDTQVLAYLLNNQRGAYSLDSLTGQKQDLLKELEEEGFVEPGQYKTTADFWKTYHGDSPKLIEHLVSYCKQDVRATHNLYKSLQKRLPPECVRAYYCLEAPMLEALVDLETTGALVDRPLLTSALESFGKQKEELESTIATSVGRLPQLQFKEGKGEFVPVAKFYGGNTEATPIAQVKVYVNKLHVPPHYTDAEGVFVCSWPGHVLGSHPLVLGAHCPLLPFNSAAATGHVWWVIRQQCASALEGIKKTPGGKPKVDKDFLSDIADLLPETFPIGRLARVVKKLQMAKTIYVNLGEDNRIRAQFAHTRTLTGRLATSNP